MIQREALVRQFNPTHNKIDVHSPLTIGNGDFAFTADITGLQTLYSYYDEKCPLLTMSTWGWHTTPSKTGVNPILSDLEMTEYEHNGRSVKYPVNETPNNKEAYKWLRENPHRINLLRLRLTLGGCVVSPAEITGISQELDMFTGVLTSKFLLTGQEVTVTTCVGNSDTLAVKIESKLCKERLSVIMDFPYGSPEKSASDFEHKDLHSTKYVNKTLLNIIERKMDEDVYYCLINGNVSLGEVKEHSVKISAVEHNSIVFTLSLGKDKDKLTPVLFKTAMEESKIRMYTFWNKGAFIDLTESEDERAEELERRIITSMYLSRVQDLSFLPPQETGLTCNSWYGKFHLEMHPIHIAYAALYGRGDLLEKSLTWYVEKLPKAVENAKRNGYKGARWPKMVGPEGEDSPSVIAPLLVWQQPHIIYMLELLYRSRYSETRVEVPTEPERKFLERYADVVRATAEFMADFLVYNKEKDVYELLPPMYSVQEKGDPTRIKNPGFECAYFSFGLQTACKWLERLNEKHKEWLDIAKKIATSYINNGKYQAYEGYDDTYEKLNLDHPSQVFQFGYLGEIPDKKVLQNSLKEIRNTWDIKSLWGWDFAFLSMVMAKHISMEEAFDMLLMDTEKNTYVKSGNNAQMSRTDLPLYMPGNGSLLLAMTMLSSCKGWYVNTEGLMKYPF